MRQVEVAVTPRGASTTMACASSARPVRAAEMNYVINRNLIEELIMVFSMWFEV